MANATALGYQMMIEDKFLNAAINAEQRGSFLIASHYASIHAEFLGLTVPPVPIGIKTMEQAHEEYLKYYFTILRKITIQVKTNLEDVRKKYGNKTNDIPTATGRN